LEGLRSGLAERHATSNEAFRTLAVPRSLGAGC
jgi:hypothetical protein